MRGGNGRGGPGAFTGGFCYQSSRRRFSLSSTILCCRLGCREGDGIEETSTNNLGWSTSMSTLKTMTYDVTGRIARITLNRPQRGNGITLDMPRELAECVERADLDPTVHVIALSGNGKGFCGGYDLVASAERMSSEEEARLLDAWIPEGSSLDPKVTARNHNPREVWDPMIDYQMMSRNVRGFMSLFHANKPVVCKVQGFCVAGGTDMALCSDLLVIAEDAKIG